jgi:hypothetical protein
MLSQGDFGQVEKLLCTSLYEKDVATGYCPGTVYRSLWEENKIQDFELNVCNGVALNSIVGSTIFNNGLEILLAQTIFDKQKFTDVLLNSVRQGGMGIFTQNNILDYYDASLTHSMTGLKRVATWDLKVIESFLEDSLVFNWRLTEAAGCNNVIMRVERVPFMN